jgi:hypothetical protein
MVFWRFFLLFFFFLFLFPNQVLAEVVINEFSPASDPEWIEIYNPENQTVSLKEVILFFDSNLSTTQRLSFCDNEEIASDSFRLITRPTKSFWLANGGDTLVLKRGDDIIDSVSYGSGQIIKTLTASQSATRSPDDKLTWIVVDNPTPQGEAVSFECPTPTLAPTATPEPTNTPAPTSTATPRPSTPIPSQKATPTPTLKITSLVATDSGEVLGEEVATLSAFYPYQASDGAERDETTLSSRNKIFPKIFLVVGLLLVFASAFWGWYRVWYTQSK